MKAITLYQPWAGLIALGIKKYETRPMWTGHRGDLLIHAGKRPVQEQDRQMAIAAMNRSALSLYQKELGIELINRLGSAVCLVDLTNCFGMVRDEMQTAPKGRDKILWPTISEIEAMTGNWASGRWAWEVQVRDVFPARVPMLGKQGIWNVADTDIEALNSAAIPF